MAGSLRRISGAELSRYLEERQRAWYAWIGSPCGLEEEAFRRWLEDAEERRERRDEGTLGAGST